MKTLLAKTPFAKIPFAKTPFTKTLSAKAHKVSLAIAHRAITVVIALVFATGASAQVTPSGGYSDRPILQGGPVKITWTRYIESPSVDIFLWNASTSERIVVARNVSSPQNVYQWTVPPSIVSGARYRFVVEPTNERYRRMMSGGWVTIGTTGMHKDVLNGLEPASASVMISPQPARETVRIQFETDVQMLRVVNLQGSTVVTRPLITGERTVDLDVQGLAAGMYSVVLTSSDGSRITSSLQVMP